METATCQSNCLSPLVSPRAFQVGHRAGKGFEGITGTGGQKDGSHLMTCVPDCCHFFRKRIKTVTRDEPGRLDSHLLEQLEQAR